MWRSVFLAVGITLCIVGLECLVIDEAVIAKPTVAAASAEAGNAQQQFQTKEWMPWTFMSTGAVIILYSITLPKRFNQG